MNKNELVRSIANNAGITIKQADEALDAVIAAITEGLKSDGKVQISGFGIFELKHKEDRDGVNPMTGEKIRIAASSIPTFKFGKTYKDSFDK